MVLTPFDSAGVVPPVMSNKTLRSLSVTGSQGYIANGWRYISNRVYMNVWPEDDEVIANPEYLDSPQILESIVSE